MYSYQKGMLPILTTLLGIFIPSVFFVYALKTLLPYFVKLIYAQPLNTIIENTISLVIGLALYWLFPFIFGIFFSGMFPPIRLTEKGIEFLYFGGLLKGFALWNEITKLRNLPFGYMALEVSRPGFPLFNGMYMNSLYGRLIRVHVPVILIAPKTENQAKIIEKILRSIPQKQ